MRVSARSSTVAWRSYLDSFHAKRPGITENVLSTATDVSSGVDPYGWLVSAASRPGRALDVACGSGPVADAARQHHWVGVDRSVDELTLASTRGGLVVVRGDAGRLPFSNATFDLVTCSMGLMLFDEVETVLSELRRLLRPGGTVAFLLPGGRPLSRRDRVRYLRVLVALHEPRPAYPNNIHLLHLRPSLRAAGFEVVSDERRRFVYPLPDEAACRLFVDSLYTPGRSVERIGMAHRVAVNWVGSEVGLPLRRVVCRVAATRGWSGAVRAGAHLQVANASTPLVVGTKSRVSPTAGVAK
ncbi:MAG: class I SAM-dependent methyltransferase [Acidimicrobiales bacterium]